MSNILITGSSSGFGYLTAITLAKRGHTVFATMRDPHSKNRQAADELRRVSEAEALRIHVLDLDVTSDASVNAAVAQAIGKAGSLDVVFNNAGYTIASLSETVTSQQLVDQLDTNVVGMQRVNRAVLPHMRERRSGLLVHVSSTLGRTVLPFLGPYTITKWAVEAFAETYRYELKLSGVEVAIVQPGAFPTQLLDKTQTGRDEQRAGAYGPLANGHNTLSQNMERMFAGPDAPDPQEVADAVAALVESPVGHRPARVVVDRFGGDPTRQLNDVHAAVQKGLLGAMGLEFLAD